MATTILPTNFKVNNVSVSVPKAVEITDKDGKKTTVGKKAYMNYAGGRFSMQTATNMRVPFGLNVYDQSNPPKYSINLSFNGYQDNQDVKAFYEAIQALDKHIVDEAVKNSEAWFGKKKSREVLEEFYTPSLKFGKKDDYPPTMKLNLRKLADGFETKFYDIKGKPYKSMPIEEMLMKGTQVTCLINCADVWIAGTGKFNLRWNVEQIVIHKRPEKGGDFAMNLAPIAAVGGVEEEEETALPSRAAAGGAGKAVAEDHHISDDEEDFKPVAKSSVLDSVMPKAAPAPAPADDDEDGEDTEPIPAPKKPVVKKKVVVGKK
jgi:hypothetical protein